MKIKNRHMEKSSAGLGVTAFVIITALFAPVLYAEEIKEPGYEKMVAAHKTARYELEQPIADTMTLDKLVRQLTTIQQQAALEKQAGKEEQERLKRMLALLDEEKKLLKKEVRAMEQDKHTNRIQRIKWLEEQQRWQKALSAGRDDLKQAEETLLGWKVMLPKPLKKEMEKVFDQLKTADKRSVSQRLQTIITMYTKIERYQKGINTAKQLLIGDDGKTREYDVLYIGLAVGYAVSTGNKKAGVGRPGIDGWQWEWRPELAGKIRKSLDYYSHSQISDFVYLPVKLERDMP